MAWKPIVGQNYSAAEFDTYCHGLTWQAWRPSFIVLHNTAVPSLAQRPNGFTKTQINNLADYYKGKGWSAGPHLFIDDKQIWVFTPLTMSGVHSPSWNKTAIGIEMLGDYEVEDFTAGRGDKVRDNTVAAIATLSAVLGLNPDGMRLHKEDPETNHDCPGKTVKKADVIERVKALMIQRHNGEHPLGHDSN